MEQFDTSGDVTCQIGLSFNPCENWIFIKEDVINDKELIRYIPKQQRIEWHPRILEVINTAPLSSAITLLLYPTLNRQNNAMKKQILNQSGWKQLKK